MAEGRALPEKLADYRPSDETYMDSGNRVLFGIDSDGCVDKGMRLKHGGPFPRAGIENFSLQSIDEQWRIAWSYVNEIEDRGCPRLKALAMVVDRVLEMPAVQEAEKNNGVRVPRLEYLKVYVKKVADGTLKGYGDNVLDEYMAGLSDGMELRELYQVREWSKLVNRYVEKDCPYIPPFANAVSAIQYAAEKGVDIMIVSGTPEEHLRETWRQHGLTDSILGVFGKEAGKKEDHLVAAMNAVQREFGKTYDIAIMFGDAPGDDKARKKANALFGSDIRFMPVRVGHEDEDWQWFAESFLCMERSPFHYTSDVEAERVKMFEANLKRKWRPSADITDLFPMAEEEPLVGGFSK